MIAKEIKRTLQSEFVRTLRKPFVDAVKAYGLVKPSDKVAVCISGGKDSMRKDAPRLSVHRSTQARLQ